MAAPGPIAARGERLDRWRDALLADAEGSQNRDALRAAAEAADARAWTAAMTGVVVRACAAVGWRAAAKGHRLEHLPQAQQEYLGIDVMAFEAPAGPAPGAPAPGLTPALWPAPAAVFELENQQSDDRVAYSLWKVSCVRAGIGVVIAYRRDWARAADLVRYLGDNMPAAALDGGQTLALVVGSHERGASFPWGFFRFWQYERTLRGFGKW